MKINFTKLKWKNFLAANLMLLVIGLAGCSDDDPVLSGENDLSGFTLLDVDREFTIDETTGAITNEVALPYGYDVSSLVATFSFAEKAMVTVGDVAQVSGETANDFTSAVTYTVTAEDETTANYVVTVNVSTSAWTMVTEDAFISLTRPSAFTHDDKLWMVGAVEVNVITDFGMEDPGQYFEYVYSSSDGMTWDVAHVNTTGANDSVPLGTSAGTIAYNGSLVNVGGLSGAFFGGFGLDRSQLGISTSTDDGANWTTTDVTEEGVPSVLNAKLLENDGDLFIVGAQPLSFGQAQSINSMDIYKSTNGTSWEAIGTDVLAGLTVADAPPPTYYATTLFNSDMYIAGGIAGAAFVSGNLASYAKSAYKSADGGVTWTVATAEGFPQLIGTQLVTYKGKMYAIGGVTALADGGTEDEVAYKSDIYVSEDGSTWTLIEGGLALPAEFEGRAFHNAVVMGDKIYIIAGENAQGDINDVWVGEFVN
ncbi:MAG: DUF6242 domain-containing protein [Reichenbachiella sp.]|uniref:DUF6242 domain-containing protein n=1 Tax=Reichenbachiella sp. TaxID=2184521 RepID=UPI0032635F59